MYNEEYTWLKHTRKIEGQLSLNKYNISARCAFMVFSSRETEVLSLGTQS